MKSSKSRKIKTVGQIEKKCTTSGTPTSIKIIHMCVKPWLDIMYRLMTEELVICEVRIDKAAGRGNSDSRMTSFEVIMPLKRPSTMKDVYCKMRCIALTGNSCSKLMTCSDKGKIAV